MTRTFVSPPLAAALSVAITVLASSGAAAQTTGTAPPVGETAQTTFLSTPEFARLVQGKTVWITTSDGTRRKSQVVALSKTSITVAENTVITLAENTVNTVAFDQIVKVEQVTNKPRNRVIKGALIGFGSGFGGMALLLASCWDDECEPNLGPAFAFGALGAGIGAAIGALVNLGHANEDVLYDARSRTKTLALVPILSPTRKGLAFSMTWR